MTDRVIVEFAPVEALHLRDLIDEFLALLDSDDLQSDPALDRLAPNPYPDDEEAAAQFQHSTRDALVERRVQDAHPVRERLDRFVAGMDPRQRAALISQPLSIPAEHLDGWMRTLAALRLVVASRLGIAISDDHEFTDPRFHLYDWLGYRLDELIRLADERDAMES